MIIIANLVKIPTRLQKNPKLYFIESTSAINHLMLRRSNLNSFLKHRNPRTSTKSSFFSFYTSETKIIQSTIKKRNFNFFSLLCHVFVAFFLLALITSGRGFIEQSIEICYEKNPRRQLLVTRGKVWSILVQFFLSHLAGEVVWITNFRCRLMNESESDNDIIFRGNFLSTLLLR